MRGTKQADQVGGDGECTLGAFSSLNPCIKPSCVSNLKRHELSQESYCHVSQVERSVYPRLLLSQSPVRAEIQSSPSLYRPAPPRGGCWRQ